MSTSGEHPLNLPTSIPPGEDALDRLAVAIDSYAKNAESMKRRSWWALSGVLLLVLVMEGRNFIHDREIARKLEVPPAAVQEDVRDLRVAIASLNDAVRLLRESQGLLRGALNTNADAAAASAEAGAALGVLATSKDSAHRKNAAALLTNAARQARHIVRAEATLPDDPAPR